MGTPADDGRAVAGDSFDRGPRRLRLEFLHEHESRPSPPGIPAYR
ncbi:hypothetical protein [Streptomyces avicenniae]|nr:hypothetical protein [Streptomyces avicenniae]